jgi:hypothetical protein
MVVKNTKLLFDNMSSMMQIIFSKILSTNI